ncbi:hypothetical protein AHF37_00874 [Paragonimus kellicotti]|nr:hypothetical protein AHF37_00874 [Paragonimus kellicotti]
MWYLFSLLTRLHLFIVARSQDDDLFVKLESCKIEARPGNWCEWGPWGSCVRSSCTRTRRRLCDCPPPEQWDPVNECTTIRPQNDFLNESKLVKHTRYIRFTTDHEPCEIPIFLNGHYFPDCIPHDYLPPEAKNVIPSTHKACQYAGVLKPCEQDDAGYPRIQGMQELDIGACDGWGTNIHRRSSAPASNRFTYGADSELGQQCSFTAEDSMSRCVQNYFYGPKSASDFGRLTNLAYEIDNCRFACAIRRTCRSIEFVKGVSCTLITDTAPLADEHYLGVIVESKNEICDGTVIEPYAFAEAVSLLENKYEERPVRTREVPAAASASGFE